MFKNLSYLLSLTLLISLNSATACDADGNTGFLPENNLKREVGAKANNTMTEARFNAIIDRADKVYKPIVKDLGGRLKWKRDWKSGTVNAYAKRTLFGSWQVAMFGGLARHELVTDDGFALVVCHELGHHIGGAPHSRAWASNEGQSDYFGAMKCFRRIYESDDNQAIVAKMDVPAIVKTKCSESYTSADDVALCTRTAMAGKSLALLLGSLRSSAEVKFATPDTKVVSSTVNSHPAAQCRLDTYFAGALCDKRISDEVSAEDTTSGVCNRIDGYDISARPLCWFKPDAE